MGVHSNRLAAAISRGEPPVRRTLPEHGGPAYEPGQVLIVPRHADSCRHAGRLDVPGATPVYQEAVQPSHELVALIATRTCHCTTTGTSHVVVEQVLTLDDYWRRRERATGETRPKPGPVTVTSTYELYR